MSQVAFLFPGQGSQTIGMSRTLLESLPAARQLFAEAADILGYDLAQVCLQGPAERLNSTVVSQPAIFVSSLAALESAKVTHAEAVTACTATAGLSLGEYTALVFAGALSFRDALAVVQARGAAMQAASDATPSGMVAVLTLEEPAVAALCTQARGNEILEVANYLCPGNIVLSGTNKACAALERAVEAAGARSVRLPVAGAFHTAIMKPADATLARVLENVEIRTPRIPVWSNVDGRPHTDPRAIRELLVRQVVEPVLWEKTMRGLMAAGFNLYYELGPGRVLAGLLKRVQRRVECVNITA